MLDSPEFQGYRGFASKEAGSAVTRPSITLIYNYTDSVYPSLSIISPTNKSKSISSLVFLNISAFDDVALDSVWYSINVGVTNLTYSSPVNLNLSNGNFTLFSWANDSFGNVNSTSITFEVAVPAPSPKDKICTGFMDAGNSFTSFIVVFIIIIIGGFVLFLMLGDGQTPTDTDGLTFMIVTAVIIIVLGIVIINAITGC